jgi:methenyltetrahydromethanopterin cyclohydrolase
MQPPTPAALDLNRRAARLVEEMLRDGMALGLQEHRFPDGSLLIDAGVQAPGGLEAGLWLARICLAGLGRVEAAPGGALAPSCPEIVVATDRPVAACMASQYAGWQIAAGKFFAMGSGPMRAAYGGEELFAHIGCRETAETAVGVLETGSLPGPEVFALVAGKARVAPGKVILAAAPTRSLAGGVQVVARSVETALHKLHTLGFDLGRVASGFGAAPLPPPARNDLAAIGRTNDAVLYGARVTLWVRGDDESLAAIGPRVPSSSSPDHGASFAEVFERYGRDFYKIDPNLFSPAEVAFQNLESGRTHRFGRVEPALLERSFFA